MRSDAKLASMLTKLVVSESRQIQIDKAAQILLGLGLTNPHPDLLWIEPEEKSLGVKDAKKIREFLSFKPHSAKGRAVVVLGADTFSLDAQNSLLKTLEEPPETTSIILTATSEEDLLQTILSRVETIRESDKGIKRTPVEAFDKTIKTLFFLSIEERFQVIEESQDREGFFKALVIYIAKALPDNPNLLTFAKEVQRCEKFYKHKGNIRTVLEYLMLSLEKTQS